MEEKLNQILANQAEQQKSLTRLETSVMGDEDAGIQGLAHRVGKTEKYIDSDKKFKAKAAGGMVVLSFIWSAIIKFWDKIFN